MKRAIIVGLLCLNVGLLVWLVSVAGTPTAKAQVLGGGNDYMLLTGEVAGGFDALYMLDLASRKIRVLRFDKTTKRMVSVGLLDLKREFGRQVEK